MKRIGALVILSITSTLTAHAAPPPSKVEAIDKQRASCLEEHQDTAGTIDCLDKSVAAYRTATQTILRSVQRDVPKPLRIKIIRGQNAWVRFNEAALEAWRATWTKDTGTAWGVDLTKEAADRERGHLIDFEDLASTAGAKL